DFLQLRRNLARLQRVLSALRSEPKACGIMESLDGRKHRSYLQGTWPEAYGASSYHHAGSFRLERPSRRDRTASARYRNRANDLLGDRIQDRESASGERGSRAPQFRQWACTLRDGGERAS